MSAQDTESKTKPVPLAEMDHHLSTEVEARSGTKLKTCLACLTCSGGCPFIGAMGFRPPTG